MQKDTLALEKDLAIEKKEWPILRAGWIFMGLIVAGGAMGLFGGGFLSHTRVSHAGLSIQYDKLLRYSLSSKIIIEANKLSKDSSILVNSDYTKKIKIEEVTPEPESVKLEGQKIRYKFHSRRSDNIVFYLKPIGRGEQRLLLEFNGFKLDIHQFIFF
ncbi:hypothetical protein [Desertivirga brevis]|uniref:hypothetical protein n=1 Tax=Desertivirga brevis TaxID=2810310 RepID=UPI001A967EFC|nr:hypothetical protein [Pedobacter sp. SYSU D00873]